MEEKRGVLKGMGIRKGGVGGQSGEGVGEWILFGKNQSGGAYQNSCSH